VELLSLIGRCCQVRWQAHWCMHMLS
jgi:hypothetical protein